LAVKHALKRTRFIRRQFRPEHAPLTHLESNYVGVLGELAVRSFLGLSPSLDDDYDNQTVDRGDVTYKGKVYDVKTDAIPQSFFSAVAQGTARHYEPYACRVYTASHIQHLPKYTGGVIFCIYRIPDEEDRETEFIRESLLENRVVILTGFIPQNKVTTRKPTWYSQRDPEGNRRKYNSKNYVFFRSDLRPVNQLIS